MPFTTLARSIVGQQISVKAAQTVWDRFARWPRPRMRAARPVLALERRRMRAAGLSARKVEYLLDLAAALRVGRGARARSGSEMDDEAIIEELVAIRGIGRWTAEMFLIFHLLRPERAAARRHRPDQGHQPATISAASRCRAPMRARSATPGRPSARSPHGTFGAASTRCRWSTEPGSGPASTRTRRPPVDR